MWNLRCVEIIENQWDKRIREPVKQIRSGWCRSALIRFNQCHPKRMTKKWTPLAKNSMQGRKTLKGQCFKIVTTEKCFSHFLASLASTVSGNFKRKYQKRYKKSLIKYSKKYILREQQKHDCIQRSLWVWMKREPSISLRCVFSRWKKQSENGRRRGAPLYSGNIKHRDSDRPSNRGKRKAALKTEARKGNGII